MYEIVALLEKQGQEEVQETENELSDLVLIEGVCSC